MLEPSIQYLRYTISFLIELIQESIPNNFNQLASFSQLWGFIFQIGLRLQVSGRCD